MKKSVYRDVKVCINIVKYIKQTIQGQSTLVSQYVIKSYPFGSRNLRMMINKVLEKRQVDEDSDSDYVDLEEDFDPVINKGFCKSIYPLIVKLFVSKQ